MSDYSDYSKGELCLILQARDSRISTIEQQLKQAQAELDSYKAGIEVEVVVNKYGELHFLKDLPDMANQRVRVLVRAKEVV